jgi:beta-lactamase superfamily II metal-dependent hydrolase
MLNNPFAPPEADELEVSVFGPGYGEAIVIHIGGGKWILVDSCIDPDSSLPAPLRYLYGLGVDLGQAVRLIVTTHWHDDHIRGISKVFALCESAEFFVSSALPSDEFFNLVELYSNRTPMRSSGVDEFTQVFKLLEARKRKGARFNSLKLASADRLIYRDRIQLGSQFAEAKVYSLSPSDSAIVQAKVAFAQLLPSRKEQKKRVASPRPNHTSVVLWLEVAEHRVLLGADLEKTTDPKTGWSVIVTDSTVTTERAAVFKIPHHGSENGHHEEVWSKLLLKEPIVVLSPFSGGKKPLPSLKDVERITSLTPNAYATALARHRRMRWKQRVVKDMVAQATSSIHSVHNYWGHVRFRQKINEVNNSWQIELFGQAYQLQPTMG